MTTFISRILFVAAFVIVGLSIWEKMANILGLTVMRGYYSNWQLLAFSAIALLFVIALQLREIKISLLEKKT